MHGNKKIIVSTGNILSANKKAGQKTTEELFDSLNLTLSDALIDAKSGHITRNNDDLLTKVTEYERGNIKIGAKVFLNSAEPELLREALNNLLTVLNVNDLDNLILAYHPAHNHNKAENGTTNGSQNGGTALASSLPKDGVLTWGNGDTAVTDLKELWRTLESYADNNRIRQLGIADLDTDTLADLYASCRIKPAIAQINLSACCVVPPEMQEFCAKHDIQLLTHSDSEVIISKATFGELTETILEAYTPTWATRYQVHIKCRGVLTAKGFVMGAECD